MCQPFPLYIKGITRRAENIRRMPCAEPPDIFIILNVYRPPAAFDYLFGLIETSCPFHSCGLFSWGSRSSARFVIEFSFSDTPPCGECLPTGRTFTTALLFCREHCQRRTHNHLQTRCRIHLLRCLPRIRQRNQSCNAPLKTHFGRPCAGSTSLSACLCLFLHSPLCRLSLDSGCRRCCNLTCLLRLRKAYSRYGKQFSQFPCPGFKAEMNRHT